MVASAATLSKYEVGKRATPSDDLVDALAQVLDFDRDFFFTPLFDEFADAECSFRRRAVTAERTKKRTLAQGTLFAELVRFLANQVSLPPYRIPLIPTTSVPDAEKAADRCRAELGLPLDAPIGNMCRVLEPAGVAVTYLDAKTEQIDAFCRRGPTSVVVLNAVKGSASRTRFDAAHELGHLVMHGDIASRSRDEVEREANSFASAFLLPRAPLARALYGRARVDWPHFMELKRTWRVSLAAIVRRAFDLGLIDAVRYRQLNVSLHARGWHRGEPDELPAERPELIPLALRAFRTVTGESAAKVCAHLHWRQPLFESLTGVRFADLQDDQPNQTVTGTSILSLDDFRTRRSAAG